MSTQLRTKPIRANELLAQIADTSPEALKIRDRLLVELQRELQEISQLEEAHLLPLLRKHSDTQNLGVKLVDSLKERSQLLSKLERLPPEGDDFSRTAVELKRAFRRHLRDEKNEFLPAIDKVLTDEEAVALLQKVEADRAQMALGEHPAAKHEAPQGHRRPAVSTRAGPDAPQAALKSARETGEAVGQANDVRGRSVAEAPRPRAEQARTAPPEVKIVVPQANTFPTGLMECNAIAREPLQKAALVWIDRLQEQAQSRVRYFVELASCRSPLEFMDIQSRMWRDEIRLLLSTRRTPAT
jgi:hypothetical protein